VSSRSAGQSKARGQSYSRSPVGDAESRGCGIKSSRRSSTDQSPPAQPPRASRLRRHSHCSPGFKRFPSRWDMSGSPAISAAVCCRSSRSREKRRGNFKAIRSNRPPRHEYAPRRRQRSEALRDIHACRRETYEVPRDRLRRSCSGGARMRHDFVTFSRKRMRFLLSRADRHAVVTRHEKSASREFNGRERRTTTKC